MPAAKKPPARPATAPFSLSVPFAPKTTRPRTSRKPVAAQPEAPAVAAQPEAPAVAFDEAVPVVPAVPAPVVAPAAATPGQPKRRRLAKAFDRPLDKVLRKKPSVDAARLRNAENSTVRDGFTFPKAEHDRLVELKKQLAEQGVIVKKSDLIRVGLILALSISPTKLKAVLAKLPPVK